MESDVVLIFRLAEILFIYPGCSFNIGLYYIGEIFEYVNLFKIALRIRVELIQKIRTEQICDQLKQVDTLEFFFLRYCFKIIINSLLLF